MNTTELLKSTAYGAVLGGALGCAISAPVAAMASLFMGATALSLHKFCNDPSPRALDNSAHVVKWTFKKIQITSGATGAVIGAVTACALKVAIYFVKKSNQTS